MVIELTILADDGLTHTEVMGVDVTGSVVDCNKHDGFND